MSSRDVILQRIRSGLTNAVAAGFGDLREPPVPEVWPHTNPEPTALLPSSRQSLSCSRAKPSIARRWPMPADNLPNSWKRPPGLASAAWTAR